MQESQIKLLEQEKALDLKYSEKYKSEKVGNYTYKLVSESKDQFKIQFKVLKEREDQELFISVQHEVEYMPFPIYCSKKTLKEYKDISYIFTLYPSLDHFMNTIDLLILTNSFDLELKNDTFYFKVNLNSDFFKGSILFILDAQKAEQNMNVLIEQVNNLKMENKKLKADFIALKSTVDKLNKLKVSDSIVLDEEKQQVAEWIAPNKEISFELLYKASSYQGDSAASFHYYCNNKGPTVTFVMSRRGNRFGAFTSQSWSNSQNYKSAGNSFIFSLDFNEKYEFNGNNAIYDHSSCGPTFGEKNLLLADECLTNRKSFCKCSQQYNDPNGHLKLITGEPCNFGVEDYEVYKVVGI